MRWYGPTLVALLAVCVSAALLGAHGADTDRALDIHVVPFTHVGMYFMICSFPRLAYFSNFFCFVHAKFLVFVLVCFAVCRSLRYCFRH